MGIERQKIEEIKNLRPYLSVESDEELEQILKYGKEIKAEGERKKKEFWNKHNREDFLKLLKYKWKNKGEILGKYQYLDDMKGLEREKFIKEYLYDDVYNGELFDGEEEDNIGFCYDDWKAGKAVIEEGVTLDFSKESNGDMPLEGLKKTLDTLEFKEGLGLNLSGLGGEWLDVLVKKRLARGVTLNLNSNQLGDEGIKVMAENMELEEGMYLYLRFNEIGAMGVESISKMELKEGVCLDLNSNQIGDEGAKVIMENMKLKNGVILRLYSNQISEDMKNRLRKWREERVEKGINCKVKV